MTGTGIMHVARRILLTMLLVVPAAFAQTKPAPQGDDLDVTMRVIVDPNAKVPDEIVRRISLPKPAQTPASSNTPAAEPGKKDDKKPPAAAGQQGREFGQAVADEAKRRAEEAKKNKPPPPDPGPPRSPPGRPTPPG